MRVVGSVFDILVCEDDGNIRRLIAEYLKDEGYGVFECGNGNDALSILDATHIDMVITDIMMPEADGFDLVRDLREAGSTVPILMITAKERIDDKRMGFSIGADDYMVKPIDMDEMIIRVAALLRRAGMDSEKRLVIGGTTLDYAGMTVRVGNDSLELPKKEFQLLFKLLSRPNRILKRQQLMDEIWGYDAESDERTVDVHIMRLREKFSGSTDFKLVTVRGLGYKAVRMN